MKKSLVRVVKIVFLLIGLELVLIFIMGASMMSNDLSSKVSGNIYNIVKYSTGFPLVLINNSYPFFLENNKIPIEMIPLTIINLLLQTSLILGIRILITSAITKKE